MFLGFFEIYWLVFGFHMFYERPQRWCESTEPRLYYRIYTVELLYSNNSNNNTILNWLGKKKKKKILSRHDTHQLDKSHNEIGERLNLIKINLKKKTKKTRATPQFGAGHSKDFVFFFLLFLQGEMKRAQKEKKKKKTNLK